MSEEWTTVDTSNPENKENKVEYEIETEDEVSTKTNQSENESGQKRCRYTQCWGT